MKSAILVHGKLPREAYDDNGILIRKTTWFPGTQIALQAAGVRSTVPIFPRAWQPNYTDWEAIFNRLDINASTAMVGHSAGAGFLVRWLSEHRDTSVNKVILVAPSLGKNWPDKSFFDFELDTNMADRTTGLTVFGSTDDTPGIQQAIQELRNNIKNIRYKQFVNYGHFSAIWTVNTIFPDLDQELLHDVDEPLI